jgi:DNA-binding CsgD family transcriptional regulator/PAS domain-containing protein
MVALRASIDVRCSLSVAAKSSVGIEDEQRILSPVTDPSEKLLNLIYDAATEQELWRSVLTEIADRTGSQGGVLFGQSNQVSQVYFSHVGRISEECNRTFQLRHVHNPWSEVMVRRSFDRHQLGRVVLSDQIVPLSSLRLTPFFDEVLSPEDIAHGAMITLASKEDFLAGFNLCRSARQGPLGDEERCFLEGLVPHLRRSLLLGFRLDAYHHLQRAEFHVLDRLAAGVILLDRSTKVVFANAAARALTAGDSAVRLRKSKVTAAWPAHAQRLDQLVESVLGGVPVATMSIPHPEDGRLVTVLVTSIRSRDQGRFFDLGLRDAALLMLIIDPARRTGPPLPMLMDAYWLTPAEAKVAATASSGLTIPEVAAQLGLSPNTVKTHLRRVFGKTGTNGQAELTRLMTFVGLLRTDAGDI